MLQSMRRHARYFYVLFVIVIITFIFWGVGNVDKSTSVSVAEIGREKISVEEFWRTYERTRDAYREMYKGQNLDEIDKKLNLKKTVLDGMIEERVLLASARELGLTVSDEELQQAIVTDPRFRRDGVFHREIYVKTLALNRMTPEIYESMLRDQITADKLRRMIASSVDVTSADLAGAPDDPEKSAMIRQMVLYNKRNAAIRSYVEAAKKQLNIKINQEALS
ncbi:MAG TPA: SurA N-terminal domain-containing protein [Dissulfurispiraceae bacterium]|nr:SurA N-terminal domain-containing protein [Dissulfurispiraceae bacterium]